MRTVPGRRVFPLPGVDARVSATLMSATTLAGRRILMVDDDQDTREIVLLVLAHESAHARPYAAIPFRGTRSSTSMIAPSEPA